MSEPTPNTLLMPEDQTFVLLTERAKVSGDRFLCKVFRRKGVNGLAENLAIFANSTIEQLSQPEPWVARLAGGGEYTMQICHMEETAKRIGGLLKFKIPGENRPVNPYAPQGGEWEGPAVMTFPVPAGQGQPGAGLGPPAPGQQQRWGWGDQFQQIGGNGGFPVTQQAPGVPADQLFVREQAALAAHTARERELAVREAKLAKDLTEREEALKRNEMEGRMRAENERSRAEGAASARALEEKMNRILEANAAPKVDSGAGLDKVITAIAAAMSPIATALLAGAAEARTQAAARAAEAARYQHEATVQNQTLMMSLLQKPQGLPPEVTMLFEMQKNQSTGNAEMMTRIVDAMGAVSKTSVSMIEAIADMNLGGAPENPMLGVIREGVKAVSMLASGAKEGAKKQIQSQQQQQRPATQQVAPPAPLPGQSGPPNGHNNQPGSQATPVQEPVRGGAMATGPQTSAQQAPSGIAEPTRNSVEELERLIRNRYEPMDVVVKYLIASTKTPEMKEALREHDGEFDELLSERLGDWIEESTQNMDYITRLGAAFEIAGTAAGLFGPPEEDGAQPGAQPAPVQQ